MADNYIVSARKYRPDTFASIVGQGAMSSTLRTAVMQGRMAHAYLFCGPRGVGKTTAARVLAKTINCLNLSSEGEACGACESCRAFEEQRSFNIFELDAASNNGVDDIRTLTDQVLIPPVIGRYKVYIIDEVHMLSAAAFNAFLKTLEEPPSYAIFILATTEKHKVLPTVLSRCQIYDFRRITVADITVHLAYVARSEGITAEEPALALIAEKADGGMRDALSMFDRVASYAQGNITYEHTLACLNVLDYTYYTRIVSALVHGDYQGVLLLLDELLGKGFDGQVIVGGLASFMRDLLVVQHPDTAHLLEKPASITALYIETARLVSPAALHQAIGALVACDQQYRAATNKRLIIELTLLNLLASFAPSALGQQPQQPTTPTPRPAPTVQSAPVAQPVAQPTAPTAHPAPAQTAPAPTPAQSTAVPASSAQPDTPEPAPRVQVARPPIDEGMQSTRQAFRSRMSRAHAAASATTAPQEIEVVVEEHKKFDETDMQRGWMTFVDREIPEESIILRRTMTQYYPTLTSPTTAEVCIVDSPTLIDPVTEILPQVERFIQRFIHNTDLRLSIRPIKTEVVRMPITSVERYEAMVKKYPDIDRLRETLKLHLR